MTEITISNVIVFSKGFIVNTVTSLVPNIDYSLNFQYGTSSITRIYRPTISTFNIMDTWNVDIPIDGDNVCFILNSQTTQTGSINCTSIPSNAQILLDGIDTGLFTPATIIDILTGNHTTMFKLTGYYDYSQNINVTSGQIADVSYTLVPISSGINYVEITLSTTNTYTNPYTAVSLSSTFTQNTLSYIIPGFWDGGNVWKIRFRPISNGTWNYTTTSNDSQLNNVTGSIVADITGDKGYVQRSPTNNFGWQTSIDKIPHFWMSDTCWRWNQNLTRTQFEQFIDTRATQGYNHIRGHLNSMDSGLSNPPFTNYNYDTPNINYWQEADVRIKYANNKGITMDLCIGSGSRFPSITQAQRERYLNYIIARYSAYNLDWEGLSEYEDNANAVTLINAIGNFITNNDPYNHPRSTHTTYTNIELVNEIWLDWIMYAPNPGENPSTMLADRIHNKPMIDEEYYYEANCMTGSAGDDTSGYKMRKGAWKMVSAGGYFATGNVATYTGAAAGGSYNTCGLDAPQMNLMIHLYNFWNNRKFWLFEPHNSLIISGTAFLSEIPSIECAVYLPDGGSVSLNLLSYSGNYIMSWYNPRNGTYQGTQQISGGSTLQFTSPDTNDWMLHIFQQCPQPICTFNITSLL